MNTRPPVARPPTRKAGTRPPPDRATLERALAVASRTAREAGAVLQGARSRLTGLSVLLRSPHDVTAEIDREVHGLIRQRLAAAFPEHGFHVEGQPAPGRADGPTWIIDAIDGSLNYERGYPQYSVSLALVADGEAVVGVVYDPVRDELYSALDGHGSSLNGRPITCVERPRAAGSLAATVFPASQAPERDAFMAEFVRVHGAFTGVRRGGSTALELAYLACGRLDAFWARESPLRHLAAGIVLLRNAGAALVARDDANILFSVSIAAAPPALIEGFVKLLDGEIEGGGPAHDADPGASSA